MLRLRDAYRSTYPSRHRFSGYFHASVVLFSMGVYTFFVKILISSIGKCLDFGRVGDGGDPINFFNHVVSVNYRRLISQM